MNSAVITFYEWLPLFNMLRFAGGNAYIIGPTSGGPIPSSPGQSRTYHDASPPNHSPSFDNFHSFICRKQTIQLVFGPPDIQMR